MTVEVRPHGVQCNLQCQYCYQQPQRDADNQSVSYNMEAIKEAVLSEGGPFTLFGGEPLLLREEDLEELWRWGLEKFGRNGIQTNGVLINENHIRMFRKYKVHVGISIDGPDDLNDVRWQGTLKQTRQATEQTHHAIERLCEEQMHPSIILTLHRNNAASRKLDVLLDWVRYLDSLGIRGLRLHLLEADNALMQEKYALSEEENIRVLESFRVLRRELRSLRIDLFVDMRRMLLGYDNLTSCVWNACDSYTTRAVRGIEGQGQRSNCGRTNKEGIDFVKADQPGFERYVALYETPQSAGGCKGCRFFLMCKGQCPGTAIGGDWRNRTEHCGVWKALYSNIEQELIHEGKVPLSISPQRNALEKRMVQSWRDGVAVNISQNTSKSAGSISKWQVHYKQLKKQLLG